MLPSPLETLGEDSIDHVVPLRFSTNVVTGFEPSSEPPTAMQFLAEVQDTPERLLPCAPEGFGVVSMDQAVPLNTSASVTWVPGLLLYTPTAVQALDEVHDTAKKALPRTPGILGSFSIDHLLPFHSSASASWTPALLT